MINNISFKGKAYFTDNVLKNIKPEERRRIEEYAAKKTSDTDIFVFSTDTETILESGGVKYSPGKFAPVIGNTSLEYIISEDDGTSKCLSESEVNILEKPLPVYNAYIIDSYNKIYPETPTSIKTFDFRKGAQSTIRSGNGSVCKDIKF